MKRYHYTYMLTAQNPLDSRVYYFGVRSCYCLPREDTRYMSSSSAVKDARRHGVVFKKTVLRVFGYRERAGAHEMALHAKYQAADNPLFFNVRNSPTVRGALHIRVWTLEACMADALNYSTRNAWRHGNPAAYVIAKREGWLDVCCRQMRRPYFESGYLTKERCIADAARFKFAKDWREQSPRAWSSAFRNGWLPECTARMLPCSLVRKWTLDACMADALQYLTIREWQAASPGYRAAWRRGWVPQCTGHMTPGKKPAGYWTKQTCMASAANHRRSSDWMNADPSAYQMAWRNGWLPDCLASLMR